jgi:hypothetical protein
MKTVLFITFSFLLVFLSNINSKLKIPSDNISESATNDASLLKGHWKLDLSPENDSDNNFAKMIITNVGNNSLEGYFYRDEVKIREGRINTKTGIIYAALVSGDNSGIYNTSFYFKDGLLFGTTHSIDKDFLAVWTGTKENK